MPKDSLPWAMGSPAPVPSLVITQPTPAESRKEPSVHAWAVWAWSGGVYHGVYCRRLGAVRSMYCPSFTSLPRSEAPWNQSDFRFRDESSPANAGRSLRLGASGTALSAEARSRSRRRSRLGRVGGVSAARIASSPFAVLKVPATVLPIAFSYALHTFEITNTKCFRIATAFNG